MDKQTAIDLLDNLLGMVEDNHESDYDTAIKMGIDAIKALPSVQPERMTNRRWVDFLSVQFDISRTSAKEMLHGMMRWKKEDNFKKMFNGGKT